MTTPSVLILLCRTCSDLPIGIVCLWWSKAEITTDKRILAVMGVDHPHANHLSGRLEPKIEEGRGKEADCALPPKFQDF